MSNLSVPDNKGLNLQQLVEEYGDAMLRLCFLYLHDLHSAEDALQEAFIKLYQKWPTFRGACSEKTWITRIVINVCRSQLRSKWVKRVVLKNQLEGESFCYAAVIEDDTVLKEVSKLKPKYKEVVLLFYYREMKTKEIAAALGLSDSAVCVRLNRARLQLKKQLEGWYFDD